MIPEIHIEAFNYRLPDERIAKYPLPVRDESKLLIYQDGGVRENVFHNLPDALPPGSLMVFNDTRVVPARMFFHRPSGAHIEIFCLEPVSPSEYALAFASVGQCSWKCVIGNAKRWKGDELLLCDIPDSDINLRARLVGREGQTGVVEFIWESGLPFSAVLDLCGKVPIPPYLGRETEAIDLERYQTLYARIKGSVAAPTAGLHFTQRVLSALDSRGVDRQTVCLHVGAGTFLPVKSSLVSEHPMHREPFVVSLDFLEKLLDRKGPLVAVGTTSVRTLESLYYAGVSCIERKGSEGLTDVDQWAPYVRDYQYTTEQALQALADYLRSTAQGSLKLGTRIIIVPGFKFRLVDALVTNFHQPQSTLLLLVDAFVGGDWRTIYDYALAHDFRFLSYGDSSLLFKRG